MSYENPTTVVDTESARIRAAGMASFGQSVGGAITALGQRQRQEAKERKKENKAFLNSQTKYNEEYQQNSWMASDQFKEDAGYDISPQVTATFNKWADEGAELKARRDRSDDPEERRKLGTQIAVYDKFFLGGGMVNNLESFAELKNAIQTTGGPGQAGTIGGLSMSSLEPEIYRDFIGMGKGNGGKAISITGMGGQLSEDGQYSPLSLTADFDGGGTYDMSNLNNSLITIPDMQDGVVDVLKKAGYIAGNKLNTNSEGFKNFIKTEDGKVEYTSGYDTNGNEIRYQSLDFDKMYNALDPTFQATIKGYTSEGSVSGGDSSLGLKTMQSYVDDELEEMSASDREIFKEKVGVYPEKISLQIGNEEGTILDKESLDLYKKALTAQKFIELQKQMPGEKVEKPKTLGIADRKALKEQQEQLQLDQKLAGVIDKAIQSPKGVDVGLYDYLMDGANTTALDYGEIGSRSFREDIIPKDEYKEWVGTLDREDFATAFPNENFDSDGDYDFIDKQISANPDSNFISINEERPLEFLDPESAYRIMIQTVPAFADMKTSELGTARGEGDMRERDRKKSPEYKAQQVKKFETMTYEWDGNTYTGEEAYIKKEQREPSYTGSSKSNLQLRQEYQRKLQDLKK
jgi:hypothetical protein